MVNNWLTCEHLTNMHLPIRPTSAEVPHLMRHALASRPDVRFAAKANHWRFGAQSYVDVLRWLERMDWEKHVFFYYDGEILAEVWGKMGKSRKAAAVLIMWLDMVGVFFPRTFS